MSENKPLRIVIALEGGLIQGIGTNGAYPVEIVAVDYDVDELEGTTDIPQHDDDYLPIGNTAPACAYDWSRLDFEAPEWVDAVFDAVRNQEQPE